MWKASAPVVVGVDGSDAAIDAGEMGHRRSDQPRRPATNRPRYAHRRTARRAEGRFPARRSIRRVVAARRDRCRGGRPGKPVKIETDILWGSPDTALINESRNASMVCVGSVGIGAIASQLWGSTAASLAEKAYCPVAIIRSPHNPPASGPDWIVVAVQGHADDESVIEHAMNEARLRNAPVLAVGVWEEDFGETPYDELDRRIETWAKLYPDVHVNPVATRAGIARFLADNKDESVQLTVVGDAPNVVQIIGPHSHPLVAHGDCSVLVVH